MINLSTKKKLSMKGLFCIALAALIILGVSGVSHADISWINPEIVGDNMNAVFFIDNNTGFAVGDTQRIIKTTDGGATWEEIYVGASSKKFLNDVYFVDSSTGFAVGDSGTVLKTTDGGVNWSAMFALTINDLNAVYFTDATTGYVVGNSGTIVKTTNGTSWSAQTSNVTTNLTGVHFPVDATTGYVSGDGNTIISTSDSGSTWGSLTATGTAYNSVFFNIGNTNGFLVGDGGEMYKTSDSGTTWVPETSGTSAALYDVFFATQSLGFAVGATGTLLRTTDSGDTWSAVSISTSNGLYSVQFPVDTTTGYAVGEIGEILKTTDGGATWSQLNTSTFSDTSYSIQFPLDSSTGYAVGPGGKIYKTTDGGTSWTAQTSGTSEDLNKVFFPADALSGYVVGNSGTILKTEDGGTTWTALTSGTANNLHDVSFPDDPNTGFVSGEVGVVLKTTDAGTTWSSLTTSTANNLYSVYFPSDDQTGYAAGQTGTIIKTVDGGQNWSALTSGSVEDLYDIHFPLGATSGAIVGGSDGTILSTTDSGANWSATINWTTDIILEEVFFPYDTTVGYISASQQNSTVGVIYRTIDGTTWNQYYYSYDNSFYSVNFPAGTGKGFFAGDNGFVLMESNTPNDSTVPTITDNQADAWFSTYTNTFDIDLGDTAGGLLEVQASACTTASYCGDIIDWNIVKKPIGGTSYTTNWNLTKYMWDTLQEGDNYVSFKVIDQAGNQAVATSAFNMMKDTSLPTTTDDWTDIWTASSTVVVNISASDTGSGVASTYTCVDSSGSCEPGTASMAIHVVTSAGATSAQYIRYFSVDTAGNSEAMNSKRVRQDLSPPAGGTISYTNGNYSVATSTIVIENGTDEGAGISLSTIYRRTATYTNGTCGTYSAWGVLLNSGSPSWAATYNDTGVTSGNCYQYKFTEQDGAGNTTDYCTDGTACSSLSTLAIDTTGPTVISAVNDGSGTDVDFASSTSSLMANWSASADSESGLMAYYYAVGTTAGASDVVSWTSTATSTTSFATSGVTLTNGSTYYVIVKAENNHYVFASATISDGVTIDTTGPSAVSYVYDGLTADVDVVASSSTVSANWDTSSDAESGIAAYWYGIGTTSGGTDVKTWTSAGTATSVTATGLSLSDGTTYYFAVKAQNGAGIFASETVSDGFSVASTPPSSAVSSPTDGAMLSSLSSITGTASDSTGLGISVVEILITDMTNGLYWGGSTWGASMTWLTASGTTTWTYSSSLPTWSDAYYTIKTRATGNSGAIETPGTGVSFTIDTTAPVISINSPTDGSTIGSSSISVSGGVETGSSVTVNDNTATVNGNTFSYSLTATEGSNTIVAVATDAAGNSSSDTVTVTVDLTPPTAEITSPTAGASVSGSVTISGTASDANFSSYILEYGAGSSPSTWQTVSSSTSAVTASQLGAADMSYFAGTYTFKLTVTDSFGTSTSDTVTVTVSNTVTKSLYVSSTEWTQIAIPMTLDSSSLSSLLDTSSLRAYYWNPTATADPIWAKYQVPTSLTAGQGLWVKAVSSTMESVSVSGTAVDTTSAYEYSVSQGWNQIGTPYNWDFTWSGISVKKDSATYTLSEAVSNGYIASAPFYYESYYGQWSMVTSGSSLSAGTGYMIDVTADGVSLVYDPEAQGSYTLARVVRDRADVEIVLSAAGAQAADPHNFIGLHRKSTDGYDGRDMREPPRGMSENYVSLYFPHEDWVRGARYAADYRGTSASIDSGCTAAAPDSSICKTWDFVVETNESGTSMKVSWNSLARYADDYTIELTDLATNSTLDMTTLSEYSYTSDATSRSFRVEVAGRGAMPARLTYNFEKGWNLISIPLDPEVTDAAILLAGLDIETLLQHFEGRFFSVDDDEGVDIQAGLGYWIYLDNPLSIEFEGLKADPYAGLTVPLTDGWNLVGNPFEETISWSDNIEFVCNGEQKNLSDAVSAGWTNGMIYSYDNDINDYTAIVNGDLLATWKGYFIRMADGCSSIEFKK